MFSVPQCDGKAMHAGGSDMEAPEAHYVFKLEAKNGKTHLFFVPIAFILQSQWSACAHDTQTEKPMELKAATVGDARNWIKAIQAASKGLPPPGLSPTVTPASNPTESAPAAPPVPAAAAVEASGTSHWRKVVSGDSVYYHNEATGQTSWDTPAEGFME